MTYQKYQFFFCICCLSQMSHVATSTYSRFKLQLVVQWKRPGFSKGPNRVGPPPLILFTCGRRQIQSLKRRVGRWTTSKKLTYDYRNHHRQNLLDAFGVNSFACSREFWAAEWGLGVIIITANYYMIYYCYCTHFYRERESLLGESILRKLV
jgi:hypothetical protein